MKKHLIIASILCLTAFGPALAAEQAAAHKNSPELEKMKALAGTWTGTVDMGQGSHEMTVEYHVLSGGSVVEERILKGTPHEMVTMYYDQQGKLALTHYCMLGNRPGMVMKSADAKTIHFDFDATCGVDGKTEMHMHSLAITFDGPDSITQDWKLFEDGKAKDDHPFTLKRVKTS
jgi:hypothetical protein